MYDLYNSISNLCAGKGITIGKMCTDTGISKGIFTDLKMGRKKSLSVATLSKIAEYFSVPMDSLLGKHDIQCELDIKEHNLAREREEYERTESQEEKESAAETIKKLQASITVLREELEAVNQIIKESPASEEAELSEVKKKIIARLNQMSDEQVKHVSELLDVLDPLFKDEQ